MKKLNLTIVKIKELGNSDDGKKKIAFIGVNHKSVDLLTLFQALRQASKGTEIMVTEQPSLYNLYETFKELSNLDSNLKLELRPQINNLEEFIISKELKKRTKSEKVMQKLVLKQHSKASKIKLEKFQKKDFQRKI